MKTLVVAAHSHGPFQNGADGCFGRWAAKGMCPGVEHAAWLNSLGEDEEFFVAPSKFRPQGITNGEVRANWLRAGNNHLVAVEPALAQLLYERTQLKKELSRVSAKIRQYRIDKDKASKE